MQYREDYQRMISAYKDNASCEEHDHTLTDVESKIDELKDSVFKVNIIGINGNAPSVYGLDDSNTKTIDFSGDADKEISDLQKSIDDLNNIKLGYTGWDYDRYNETGEWYYKENDEYIKDAWKNVGGKWYAFDPDGKMRTGWYEDKDGKWYYLDNTNGDMFTGKHEIDGQWSEFADSGEWLGYTTASSSSGSGDSKKNYYIYGTKGEYIDTVKAKDEDEARTKAEKITDDPGFVVYDKKIKDRGGYSEGGYVRYTGLAMVHGSPSKPEAFLDAVDTSILRSMLDTFSYIKNKPYMSHIDPSMYSNNTNVGDINITINQAEINSDTDVDNLAKRVGQAFTKELQRNGLNLSGYAFG